MVLLGELDHVKSGAMSDARGWPHVIERIIFPTVARTEQLVADAKILAGGPAVARIALRFILEPESP
jgi:hypothetical protein